MLKCLVPDVSVWLRHIPGWRKVRSLTRIPQAPNKTPLPLLGLGNSWSSMKNSAPQSILQRRERSGFTGPFCACFLERPVWRVITVSLPPTLELILRPSRVRGLVSHRFRKFPVASLLAGAQESFTNPPSTPRLAAPMLGMIGC